MQKTIKAWSTDTEIFKINEDDKPQELMTSNAGLEITQMTKFNSTRNFKFIRKEAYMAKYRVFGCLVEFFFRMLSAQKYKVNNLQRYFFASEVKL